MPVEIREIVIRAVVPPDELKDTPEQAPVVSSLDEEILVKECVRQVMALLKKKEER